MLDGVAAQAFSDTIGAIYDCALDPDRWPDALRRIAELCDSPLGSLGVQNIRNPEIVNLYDYGYKPEFWPQYQKYIDLSPITPALGLIEVGGVLSLGMICDDEELLESRYYKQVLQPHGYLDFVGILGLRSSGRVAGVHVCRHESDPRYGEREIALLKLLSPHVCRTLAITDALDLRTLKSELLEKTLDGLAAGVYLTGRDGRVVYLNDAAERQIRTGNALRVTNGRLIPTDSYAQAALAEAIETVARDETALGQRGHSLAIPEAGGAGYIATLLPLKRGRRKDVMAPFAASVAIFVQDPAEAPLFPGEAFARLYGLTGGELRVLMALAQGLGAKEAADVLGIGEPTVRTHLGRIFSKTGTTRQADLLRLLQGSSPPASAYRA